MIAQLHQEPLHLQLHPRQFHGMVLLAHLMQFYFITQLKAIRAVAVYTFGAQTVTAGNFSLTMPQMTPQLAFFVFLNRSE